MALFRCVRPGDAPGFCPPLQTRRVPSNVPYFVDNIWEYLRPAGIPSRRHAVHASPSPALARRNASGAGRDASTWPVFRVELPAHAVAVQCQVLDSRMHTDVEVLRKLVFAKLDTRWSDGPLASKLAAGRLFIPTLICAEVAAVLHEAELADNVRSASIYWSDLRLLDVAAAEAGEGEVFFEAPSGYRLLPLEG